MFPHAAGKLASNGPYKKVKDIYNIEGLSSQDIQLFKQYEKKFTVNPPGRAFHERINGRVSTWTMLVSADSVALFYQLSNNHVDVPFIHPPSPR